MSHIQGNPHKVTSGFFCKSLQPRREWHDIFKVLKEKNLQPRIFYQARLSLRIIKEIKNFSDK